MTTTDILNTEVEDLWPLVRRGFAWWTSELADLVPRRWRPAGGATPALHAEPTADGGYRFTRDGSPVASPAGGPAPKVTLLLSPDQALVRGVDLPAASDRDTRRLLALDIDRLTPFTAESVFTAIGVAEPEANGRRRAVIAAAPRGPVLEALDRARAAGLDPRAVVPRAVDPEVGPLDFMPSIRQAVGASVDSRKRLWPWIAVGVLALANLAALIGRDMSDIAHRRSRLAQEQPTFDRALRIRSRVVAEERRRALNVAARARGEPLRVLVAVTEATPTSAWVQRFAWNGDAVRLAGFETEATDIAGALRRAPLLRRVRNSLTEASPKATAGQAFDVTADVAPPPTQAPP